MGDHHDQARSQEAIGEDQTLQATLKELTETREEIRRAREEAVRAWLDSMPLINEFEKFQSYLSRTKNKLKLANIAVASLESLLESSSRSIKSKQEEGAKSKVLVEEMREEVERAREAVKCSRAEAKEEEGKPKLKEEVRIKRQQLKALKLTQKAVSMEIEAYNLSVHATLRQIKRMKMDNNMVAVSLDEYYALCRKVEEETTKVNWRITASEEQRKAAEASKAKALARFEALNAKMNLGERRMDMPTDECAIKSNRSRGEFVSEEEECINEVTMPSPPYRKRREKERELQNMRGPRAGRKKKMAAKKTSAIQRMTCFLCAS